MANPEQNSNLPQTDSEPKPRETVIFLYGNIRPVRHREAHLKALRREHSMSYLQFAKRAEIELPDYIRFEEGQASSKDKEIAGNLVGAIGDMANPDDVHALGAVTLLTSLAFDNQQRARIQDLIDEAAYNDNVVFRKNPKTESLFLSQRYPLEKPARIITATEKLQEEQEKKIYDLIDNTTFGKTIRVIRESRKQSLVQYEKETSVARHSISQIEKGMRKPALPTVNALIEALPISPDGKPAQLLRLKSQGLDKMDIGTLNRARLGEIIHYLRIAQGLTRLQLARILMKTDSTVANIENNLESKGKQTFGDYIPKAIENGLQRWLGDDPINQFLRYKFKLSNTSTPEEIVDNVLYGNFIFSVEPRWNAS
jgi:transcriptional regulator with XRE-family HTH domain